MNLNKNKLNINLILLFFLYLFSSLLIYKDFGISIDEDSTRQHGLVSFNYIIGLLNDKFFFNFKINNDLPSLKEYVYREYGVIFELIAILLEKSFNIKHYRDIFYFRHFLNNFIFILSCIIFAKIIYESFHKIFLSIWGSLALYTTPRIFAHSFYNSKDLIFLSFFIFAIYFCLVYFKKRNKKYLILSALSLAFLSAVRVIGVYFFLLFLIFLLIELLEKKKKKSNIYQICLIIILYFFFLYTFWPFLWANPLNNFIYAFSNMANYPWDASVFYLGEYHHSFFLPWHYLVVWILISNPIWIVTVIIVSLFFIFFRFFKRLLKINNYNLFSLWKSDNELFSYFNLSLILVPLFIIILNNSTVYTGWRHIYFIYPSLIFLSVSFIYNIENITSKKISRIYLKIFLIFIIIINIFNLFKYHPYQNIFFNILIKNKANEFFEVDYWGLSNVEALRKLKINNSFATVCNVGSMNLNLSKKMLEKRLQDLIIIKGQNFDECGFIISNKVFLSDPKFTKKYQIPSNFKKINIIERDGIILNEVYFKK